MNFSCIGNDHKSVGIDIIYHLEKEIEEQKKTIEDLQKQLEDRTIRIQNAGSIASAGIDTGGN